MTLSSISARFSSLLTSCMKSWKFSDMLSTANRGRNFSKNCRSRPLKKTFSLTPSMFKWQYWHNCLTLLCNWVVHFWSFITSLKNNLLPCVAREGGQAEINVSIEWEILVIQSFFLLCKRKQKCLQERISAFFPQNKRVQEKKLFHFYWTVSQLKLFVLPCCLKKLHSLLLSQIYTSHVNPVPPGLPETQQSHCSLFQLEHMEIPHATSDSTGLEGCIMSSYATQFLVQKTSKCHGKVAAQQTDSHWLAFLISTHPLPFKQKYCSLI